VSELESALNAVQEDFKAYRVRAQMAFSASQASDASSTTLHDGNDGSKANNRDDEVSAQLRQKLSELKTTLVDLTKENAELEQQRAVALDKASQLESLQLKYAELASKYNEVKGEEQSRKEQMKSKHQSLKDQLEEISSQNKKGSVVY
jgi:uncharacterized protein YcbK (DUF882 family)